MIACKQAGGLVVWGAGGEVLGASVLREEKMRTRMKVGTREQGQVAWQSHTGTRAEPSPRPSSSEPNSGAVLRTGQPHKCNSDYVLRGRNMGIATHNEGGSTKEPLKLVRREPRRAANALVATTTSALRLSGQRRAKHVRLQGASAGEWGG